MAGWLALFPALALGWMVVRCLRPSPPGRPAWARWLLEGSLAVGVGLGLTAALYFALLCAGLRGRVPVLLAETVALAAAGWAFWKRRCAVETPADAPVERTWRPWWIYALRGVAVLSLILCGLSYCSLVEGNPYGEFDAIAIWNRKARFLAGESGTWRDMNSPFGAAHPGYPLLLSSAIAREWTLTGEMTTSAPVRMGVLFALAAAGTLCGALALTAAESSALLALLVLLASEGFTQQAASQYADVPLAFFILAALALLARAAPCAWPAGTLVLAGLCAGFAAWTKNEGLAFLPLLLAVAWWRIRGRACAWVAAGAVPLLVPVLAYKWLAVDVTESMFPRTAAEAISKVADGSRWAQIAGSFARSVWELGAPWTHPLLLIAACAFAFGLVARHEAKSRLWLAVPLAGLLAVDFGIYLISASDLAWHLGTSNSRLVAQVWPASLFVVFLLIGAPAVAPPRREDAEQTQRKRSRSKPNKAAGAL